jgi:exosortase
MDNQATMGVLDQFQNELIALWRRLPNKAFFLALLAAWLALFQFLGNSTFGYVATPSLFRWMLNAYIARDFDGNLGDDCLGLMVPAVVLGLFWVKHKEMAGLPLKVWWPGLLLAVLAMALHVVGYVIQQPRVSILALLAGVYGLMGLAWGPAWLRKSFFPFFLLLFCIPFASLLEPVTFPLRLLATRIVEGISHYVLAIDVIRVGTALKDPADKYQYDVAAACSGIRSLVIIGFMAVVAAFVYFRSWWRRAALVVSAAPLAVAGNVLRVLTIIIVAEGWGQQAGDYVHKGGPMGIISLLPYVPAFLGLMAAVKYLDDQGTT